MSVRASVPRFALSGLLTIACVAGMLACDGGGDGAATPTEPAPATPTEASGDAQPDGELQLTSSAFGENEAIPVRYTCDGDNVSPPLTISGVPDAASLALIVDDPDAPGGSFVHWTVWNIDPATAEVAEGTVPGNGSEGLNGGGRAGYTGPCPPSGTHRYIFTLYALDAALTIDPESSGKAELEVAIEGHILAQAELTGRYER